MTTGIRINKFLAERGVGSRRMIDVMIAQGRITVNGIRLKGPGYLVQEGDRIRVDGRAVPDKEKKDHIIILFNKPMNCITTAKDTHGRRTVFDYVKVKGRVFPIGRLDKDTTGVLLLTNDGELANKLMHPRHEVAKVYRAYLDKPLSEGDRKQFAAGVVLDGRKTAHCQAKYFHNNKKDVIVTLHEGRNRQIHRMFNALGYRVTTLERISYAGLKMGLLRKGEWRYLTFQEVIRLKKLLANE